MIWSLLNSLTPWAPPIMPLNQPWPALEKVMENFDELMQRLLEIQSGGRQRSPELIAEDERLMDSLQKRNLRGRLSQDCPEQARFKA